AYSKDWFQATVIINGERKIGYINKSDVETAITNQQPLQGVSVKSPTHIYTSASKSSRPKKSYTYGSLLKYKTFTKNWYEATVINNSKRETGYIHKSDIGSLDQTLTGYGQKNP